MKKHNKPLVWYGLTGNIYITCTHREWLVPVCKHIRKSPSSIYYNDKWECYTIRVKSKFHKKKVKGVIEFGQILKRFSRQGLEIQPEYLK